jgi:hypothetical protein
MEKEMYVCCVHSSIEDLVAIYVGPASFRIMRLLLGVLVTVHIFACAFWRVKVWNP